MFVDPELLEELTADQKEILFHKIREEQVRRWRTQYDEMRRALKPLPPPKIKWGEYAEMLPEDGEIDAAAASKRAKELEEARLRKAREEDERQSRILAEIKVQEEVQRARLESVAKRKDLERNEAEDRKRLEKEREERRMKEERELYMTQKEAREALKREQELEAEVKRREEERKKEYARIERKNAEVEAEATRQIAARQSEIYSSMQEIRAAQAKKQKEEERNRESLYAEAERKSKQHEAEKKKAVQRAREKAAKEGSLQRSTVVAVLEKKRLELSSSDAGNPNARPSRPPNEAAVLKWWKSEEGPRGVGKEPSSGQWAKWFHGPISRQESEQMLAGQGHGAFLIRLSTRIWGYTLSFNDTDRYKHFLVDAADGQYSVFGAQTRSHVSLASMVEFHNSIPVSKNGTKLVKPIGSEGGNLASLRKLI